jgi:hypothetical protein
MYSLILGLILSAILGLPYPATGQHNNPDFFKHREDLLPMVLGYLKNQKPPIKISTPQPIAEIKQHFPLDSVGIGTRIVGNPKEVSPGEYEAVVFLQFRNYTEDGKSKLCTGTLISPRTVLTVGHCLWNLASPYSKKDYTKYPQEIVTWAGVVIGNDLDPNDPRSGRIISNTAVAAKWHPRWQGGEPSDAVDMGLILLAPGQTDGIKPYELNRVPPEIGQGGIIVGYGKTNTGNKGIVKNMGTTKIRSRSDRIVGIGGESSICSGDSGGPLFVQNEGSLKVAGVASRTTWDCSPRSGSTTRVDTMVSWIDSVLEEWEKGFIYK